MQTETTKTTEQLALEADARAYLEAYNKRLGWAPYDAERQLREELRAFERDHETRYGFDAAPWLVAGLDALSNSGDGLYVALRARTTGPKRTVADLQAALEKEIASGEQDRLDEGADEEQSAEFAAAAAVSRAWLAQSAYGIWRRAQTVENFAADKARDEALDGVLGDKVEVGDAVAEKWADLVAAWLKSRRAERPDVFGGDVL